MAWSPVVPVQRNGISNPVPGVAHTATTVPSTLGARLTSRERGNHVVLRISTASGPSVDVLGLVYAVLM